MVRNGYIQPLQALIEQFERLPGIGHKTAVRLAFSVLDFSDADAKAFSDAVLAAKSNIRRCRVCQNLSDAELCPICQDPSRDQHIICVVEDAKAVMALERVKEYNGLYHVLHGTISPADGIGPEDLTIKELLQRLTDDTVQEIILATNPDISGETTAMYLSKLIHPFHIKTTRLAYGIPAGADIDYADEVTLFRALEGRRDL
ncbi:MAG: recombination mediator RecR [Eubacteriales bacterium]|nr:recombination mediator RecR [Eubacteriales bacterium]